MATNQILPFCPTDTGTNLLTQADYLAAADRTDGNQPGVASAKLNNKALRQGTFLASQLAQYISNKLNSNVSDDGDTAALLALFNSAFAPNDSFAIENLSLTSAVGASALTIAVKSSAGTNASATDIIYAGMRSSTLTSGVFNRRTITGALSVVLSSGSTLGQVNATPAYIWVYLIDNAGTLELAVSGTRYPEDALVTTVAEGGAGGADSATVIYSTTARSNVPIRLIGYLLNTQATAGTWASAGTQLQLEPASSAPALQKQIFTATGTFTIPANATPYTKFKFTIVGGGGGGGGASGSGGNPGANGGSSGATAIKWLDQLTPGATIAVTVGAFVAGGTSTNTGTSGNASSIASGTQTITTVTGGGGVGGATSGANQGSASGGTATNGDINVTGGDGILADVHVATSASKGGEGGASTLGSGGIGGGAGGNNVGGNAKGYGGGGGGAAGSGVSGGASGPGIVIVEWIA